MKSNINEIDSFILKTVVKHPGDIAQKIAEHFSVSRMTATRHLQRLVVSGQLVKTGKTFDTQYFLAAEYDKKLNVQIDASLDEYELFKVYFVPSLKLLPSNQFELLEYVMTELINNAKDHSEGRRLQVEVKKIANGSKVVIQDDGVGVFCQLTKKLHLQDLQAGLLAMTKGRVTTDPENHTGEGIYFSSRVVDIFQMEANGIRYIKNNAEDDWFYESIAPKKGTKIILTVFTNCQRELAEVFRAYTNPETMQFEKTEVLIQLAKFENERFVSRSQAKRILKNLEKFSKVILDFRDIKTVGQGFVDEVFRVYQNKHPEVSISYRNANENVLFMIERGLSL